MTAPDEPDMAAAELALGVLDGEDRAAALRRVLADPAFAREVERWRRDFAALYAWVPAVEPSAAVARRVAAIPDGDMHAIRRWRLAAAVAGLAATILLAVVLVRPGEAPTPAPVVKRAAPLLVTVLTPADAAPVAAVFDPAKHEIRLRGAVAVAPGRDAELWAIGADGVPHAAGLLAGAGAHRLTLHRDVVVAAGTTLAISIEPAGGSPKATPSGPVVATGTLAFL